MTLKTFSRGGIHPPECKLSEQKAIEKLGLPKRAIFPLGQSLGTAAVPLVQKGDTVKVGQLIAKGESFISSHIHTSVSGKVFAIDDVIDSSGYLRPSIIIDVEGDEWDESIDCSNTINRNITVGKDEIINIVKEKGIVGMGGATFPTHVKLMIPSGKKCESLIINAVECEPYLTSDHRLMLEKGEEILIGVSLLMKALDVDQAFIGIENNKPDAITYLNELAKQFDGIKIVSLKLKYPQGAEKQLIQSITKRQVPSGKLPIDVGVVVINVGTAFAVYEAVQKNKPLIQRVVTVTGKKISRPSNYYVRIGTPLSQLLEVAGGLPEDTGKIINGGPMMGKTITSTDIPVTKGTSGIVLISEQESNRQKEYNCIRCAFCTNVCPMGLEPYLLSSLTENNSFEELEKESVMDCIECGSCQYTCPANRPLLDFIRTGKSRIGTIIRNRNIK